MRHLRSTISFFFRCLSTSMGEWWSRLQSAIHPSYVAFVKCTQFTEKWTLPAHSAKKPKKKKAQKLFSKRDCNWSLLQSLWKTFYSFFCWVMQFLESFFHFSERLQFQFVLAQALFVSHFAKEKYCLWFQFFSLPFESIVLREVLQELYFAEVGWK